MIYPLYRGRRGHPPLIARAALPANLGDEPAGGLRGLLAGHAAAAREVAVDDPGVLVDLDEPADYRAACDDVADETVPSPARCLALLRDAALPPAVVAHSRAVAVVAAGLAARLNEHGLHLDGRLVEAAGLLHDIARLQSDHACAGATRLCDLGYRRVAAVTSHHMDLQPEVEGEMPLHRLPGEAEVLYLADKLVSGAGVVDLAERLAARLRDLEADPAGQRRARERLGRAVELAQVVATLVGEPAESIARRALAVCGTEEGAPA